MKQKFSKFCDSHMWLILPTFSTLAIMLGVVFEKHYPLSEIITAIF